MPSIPSYPPPTSALGGPELVLGYAGGKTVSISISALAGFVLTQINVLTVARLKVALVDAGKSSDALANMPAAVNPDGSPNRVGVIWSEGSAGVVPGDATWTALQTAIGYSDAQMLALAIAAKEIP